jgi:hypothetical protein
MLIFVPSREVSAQLGKSKHPADDARCWEGMKPEVPAGAGTLVEPANDHGIPR